MIRRVNSRLVSNSNAETPPTGSPNTWLNPAGIADFDGDGMADIAYTNRLNR